MKKLGFGCMRLPIVEGDQSRIDMDRFKGLIDTFMGRGFTYFDTAYVYHGGRSEEGVRECLVKRYPRDSYTITTKMPLFVYNTKDDLPRIFNQQLQRLGVEYFDYYLLHALNRKEYEKAKRLDAFSYVFNLKKEGKIKHVGFSFHDDAKLLDTILTENPDVEFVQLQLNYLDWDSPNVQSRLCYETATKHGKKIIVMEPLKGGALAGPGKEAEEKLRAMDSSLSIPSWGIRFCASLPGVFMVLSGMSDEHQMEDNTEYMSDFVSLTDEQMKNVLSIADIINRNIAIPCTACRYCVDGCPKNIPIPTYFSLYNEDMRMKGKSTASTYYRNISQTKGKALDCIKCGRCEAVCPQHLKIREYLELVSKRFE